MSLLPCVLWPCRRQSIYGGLLLATLACIAPSGGSAWQPKSENLRIGTSNSLDTSKKGDKEKGALETLKGFIKEETGLNNEIVRQKDWRELADKMAKGQLDVGVFQGFEFALAQEKHPNLKPLALAVNLYRYPVVYVVTRREDAVKDFAALQGKSLGLPDNAQPYLHLFVEHEAKGKALKDYFSKVTSDENVEDLLDDVIDGKVQAAAVDRAALESFKQRKPGRFEKLKEVAKSQPFPPVVIAYYEKGLDEATLKRFKDGLLGAGKKEKGKTILTLFHLTGFDPVPEDFAKVLAETRKEYPATKEEPK